MKLDVEVVVDVVKVVVVEVEVEVVEFDVPEVLASDETVPTQLSIKSFTRHSFWKC